MMDAHAMEPLPLSLSLARYAAPVLLGSPWALFRPGREADSFLLRFFSLQGGGVCGLGALGVGEF